MTRPGPGFTPEEAAELNDVCADAFVSGLIPGTFRFSRVILGAGWRRVTAPIPGFEPPPIPGVRIHYLAIGPSDLSERMFAWVCSCTQTSTMSFGDQAGAFGNALRHVPAGQTWRAKDATSE